MFSYSIGRCVQSISLPPFVLLLYPLLCLFLACGYKLIHWFLKGEFCLLLQSTFAAWVLFIQQWGVCKGWSGWTRTLVLRSYRGSKHYAKLCDFYSMHSYFVSYEVCARVQYAGSAWDELKHIRQAVGFLVRFICISLLYQELSSDFISYLLTASFISIS